MKPFALTSICAVSLLIGCAQNTTQTVSTENAAPAPASTSKPAQPVRGYARALHAVPGAGTLSLSADGEKFAAGNYGDATPFAGIHAEKVKFSAFGSDGKKVAGPMALSLDGGEDVTVLVTGVPGDVVLLPWKHKNRGPEKGKAKLAFVHSAKALPAIDMKIDGQSFRRNVKFGIATDYTVLSPGRHQIQVTYDKSAAPQIVEVEQPAVITQDSTGNILSVEQPTPIQTAIPRSQTVTLTQDVDLAAGKVYSLAVFTGAAKLPKVRLMEDKFVPEVVRADDAD
jgi:hypothetical protein